MKKIIIVIACLIVLICLNKNSEKLITVATSYGYSSEIGHFINIRERNELKNYIEETSDTNYMLASSMIDEMVSYGYSNEEIPLILYSGVSSTELEYITNLHDSYIAEVEKEIEKTTVITEVDDDSDDDGVTDEFDICDGGNDLEDLDGNMIPDSCDAVEEVTHDIPNEEVPEETPVSEAQEETDVEQTDPIDETTIEEPGDATGDIPPTDSSTPPSEGTDEGTDVPPVEEPGDGTDVPPAGEPGDGTDVPPIDGTGDTPEDGGDTVVPY